jgi:hypothetical protein
MRLKPEKVEYLSGKIAKSLKGLKKMEFAKPEDQVAGTIRRVILADLRREDEIEKEAEQLLKQHQLQINLRNLSYNTLVSRAKQELARKRKIIL